MASKEPHESLVAAGVKPSALLAPRRTLWERLRFLLVLVVALWLVGLTGLVVLVVFRPPAEPASPTLDEPAVQTLVAGALAEITPPVSPDATQTSGAPEVAQAETPATSPPDGDAGTPTATQTSAPTPTPSVQMRFAADTETVPADGHTIIPLTVEVQLSPPVPGWVVRFRADAGTLDVDDEVNLVPDSDGMAVIEAIYTPPDQAGVVNIYASLVNAAGEVVREQVVALQVIDEVLEVVWLLDGEPIAAEGPAYLPTSAAGENGLALRLARAGDGEVLGTYTVVVRAEDGGVLVEGEEAIEVDVPPGAEVPLNITPPPDLSAFRLSVTLPGGETDTREIIPMVAAELVTAVLEPPGEGLAVCGEGDRTRQLALSLAVTTESTGDHPLLLSYEVVLGNTPDTPLFQDGDGEPWAPGEVRQVFAAPVDGDEASLTLFLVDGDWTTSEGVLIPEDAVMFYAGAPGLARFTIQDAVSGTEAETPVMVPVGLRRVRMAPPSEAEAPVALENGVVYRFNPRRTVPPGPESGGGVMYTLANGDDESVPVLVTFWARGVYLTQDAGDVATLNAVLSTELGLLDAIPATTSLDWFRSLVNVAGGVRSAESSNPDLLFPADAGPFEMSYYGERVPLGEDLTNDLHRLYALGTAPTGALAVWPEACPLLPPTPTPTGVPPTPSETPMPSLTPPQF